MEPPSVNTPPSGESDNMPACLVLRLAGPLQSWGGRSQFNRRDTLNEPTKSGLIGLLAAAQGRRRQDPIEDLLDLRIAVRTDQPGSLLRDYHTVSDYRGRPLPSATVSAKGTQKPTSPAKYTGVTQRFYLQDAVFVVAVHGPPPVLSMLSTAIRRPMFPLALGRRACVPTQPLLLLPPTETAAAQDQTLWAGEPLDVLTAVTWQASAAHQAAFTQRLHRPQTIDLPVSIDDPDGEDLRVDLPSSFDPLARSFTGRAVHQAWVHLPPPYDLPPDDPDTDPESNPHDPFALLGW